MSELKQQQQQQEQEQQQQQQQQQPSQLLQFQSSLPFNLSTIAETPLHLSTVDGTTTDNAIMNFLFFFTFCIAHTSQSF
jgi:hypothetical protein